MECSIHMRRNHKNLTISDGWSSALARTQLRNLNGIIAGHNHFGTYIKRLNIPHNNFCRKCENSKEYEISVERTQLLERWTFTTQILRLHRAQLEKSCWCHCKSLVFWNTWEKAKYSIKWRLKKLRRWTRERPWIWSYWGDKQSHGNVAREHAVSQSEFQEGHVSLLLGDIKNLLP